MLNKTKSSTSQCLCSVELTSAIYNSFKHESDRHTHIIKEVPCHLIIEYLKKLNSPPQMLNNRFSAKVLYPYFITAYSVQCGKESFESKEKETPNFVAANLEMYCKLANQRMSLHFQELKEKKNSH